MLSRLVTSRLTDAHLAPAIRQMHGQLARSWTVAQLAKTTALSRSAFFERFRRAGPAADGIPARLADGRREGSAARRRQLELAQVAERVGYGSASTFSTAFNGTWAGRQAATRARARNSTGPHGDSRNTVVSIATVAESVERVTNLATLHQPSRQHATLNSTANPSDDDLDRDWSCLCDAQR
jgi:AraC-like DNA-binding protein